MDRLRGSSKSYILMQLFVTPVATFFAVVFNDSTFDRYKAIYPEYPRVVTLSLTMPPEHLHFLHQFGPAGIVGFSLFVTTLMLVFSFVGSRGMANGINFTLLLCSIFFFVGVFVSYIVGLLRLTAFLGAH
jgi:hypothetical protein